MADLNFSSVSVRKNNAALSDLIAVGSTLVCGPVFTSEQSGAIIAQHVTSKFIIDKSMMSSFLTFLPFELIIIMQDIPGHFEAAVGKVSTPDSVWLSSDMYREYSSHVRSSRDVLSITMQPVKSMAIDGKQFD